MDDNELRKQLLVGFDYCYLHDEWVNPLAEALEGVGAEEALRRTSPKAKGIWDIVLHLAVWNENIVERTQTMEKARPAEGAWPPPPDAPDEAAWEAARDRLWRSLEAVRATIETAPMETMGGPYGLGDLFCRFHHIAYHIGQITKMREVLADLSCI